MQFSLQLRIRRGNAVSGVVRAVRNFRAKSFGLRLRELIASTVRTDDDDENNRRGCQRISADFAGGKCCGVVFTLTKRARARMEITIIIS